MTEQTEKLKQPKKETTLDSKVREASEVETGEAGLHSEQNQKIHDETQTRHKIGHSASDLLVPNQDQRATLEMVDEEAGYVLTGRGYKPLVPQDISETFRAKLKDLPEVEDPAQLPEQIAKATFEYMSDKGLVPKELTKARNGQSHTALLAKHGVCFNPDDPNNGSDSLPAINAEQTVNYRIRERSSNGMRIETGIEQRHRTTDPRPENIMAALSPEMRAKVIEAFQKGGQVGEHAIHETTEDILKQTAQGYIDTAVDVVKFPVDVLFAAGKGLWGILEFERDLMFNPERAQQTSASAGDYIGKALIAGVRLWNTGSEYASDVQQKGDLRRPFEDLGNTINKWYDSLTPGDQVGIIARISAGFGIGAAASQFTRLAKPGAFVQFLEDAAQAVPKDTKTQKHAAETIKKLIESITQSDELVTPNGIRIKIDRIDRTIADKPDTRMLMSKADDLDDLSPRPQEKGLTGDHVPDNYIPRKWFTAEFNQVLERLSPGEKAFIAKHDIEIKPLRRISDKFPNSEHRAACFDPTEKTIYVAEEVRSLGKWTANDDVAFALKHEMGHAVNAKAHPFGEWISDTKDFIGAFNRDYSKLSPAFKNDLRLPKDIRLARDEVFSDLWAHSTEAQSNNPYSRLLKQNFPNVLRFFTERQ